MKCTCGENISTPQFMARLELSQLRRAVEIAQSLIDQKTAETKVIIYRVVEDSGVCHSNHLIFADAVASLSAVAAEKVASNDIPRELGIIRERHIESEVTQYCPEYIAPSRAEGKPE